VDGVAVGTELNAPPITVIVTASELEQVVAVEVTVNVKVVVDDRFTVAGSTTVAFTSIFAGIQLYVNGPVPVTVASSVVLVPFAMDLSVPAFTTGRVLTVTAVAADATL
jgi:hypothetical protein